jgi:hypothetical protein
MMIDYAAEYGIDMDELWGEHPLHPVQARIKRKHEHKAETYWYHASADQASAVLESETQFASLPQSQRELDIAEKHLLKAGASDVVVRPVVVARVKKPVTAKSKRRNHVFTDEHLRQANLAYERREGLGPNPDRLDYGA